MGTYHIGIGISRILSVFLITLILLGNLSSPTLAQFAEDEETYDLILKVTRERKTLQSAIFALERGDNFYIPLQELGRILNIKVDVDLQNETAKGFLFSEENTYSIDLKNQNYAVNGESFDFESSKGFAQKQDFGIGDIYITPDLLNKIWPLDLELDYLTQELLIRTKKELPYEAIQAREIKRAKILGRDTEEDDLSGLIKIKNNYKQFSLPAIDVSLSTRVGGIEDRVSQFVNISGRNDVLGTQANYNFNFDKEPGDEATLANARLQFERQSFAEGEMPLGLQLAQVGDIRPKPSRLIDGVLVGRGALLSTEPQKQLRDFDQITIEGTAEPGWEVELYRNSEFLGFQVVDDLGEYRFENITLNYNDTVIRKIFYGPEGQVREEEEVFSISNAMLKPGQTVFEASVLEQNNNLIQSDNNFGNQPEGFAQNYIFKRGLTPWLSAFTTFTTTPTRDDTRNYATAGLNLSFFGVSGLAEVYRDLSGGMAYDFRAAGKFAGANLNLRTAIYDDFESDEARFGDNARTSRTEFSISRPFKFLLGNFGLRFGLDNERFEKTPDQTDLDFTQSFAMSGLRLTHTNRVDLFDGDHRRTDGSLNATYKLNTNWQLRSLLNYDLYPDKDLQNLIAELRYRSGKKYTVAFDVNKNFQGSSDVRYGINSSYDFGKFRSGLDLDWEKEEGLRAFWRTTFSMAPYGPNNDYEFSSKNLSNRAALAANTYLDNNYDGVFNAGDEPIEGAIFNVGKRSSTPAEQNGYASYIGSSKGEYEPVQIDPDSLKDPSYVSSIPDYEVALRSGIAKRVEFPIIKTGTIDGIVSGANGGFSSVRMQLVSDAEIVATTTTAFDGYYSFEYIVPGQYQVRLDPSYEQILIPPKPVLVTSEDLFHYNIDFRIIEQTGEVACVVKNDSGEITQFSPSAATLAGMKQSAHSYYYEASVTDVRFSQSDHMMRMVLDYDEKPTGYDIIEAKDNEEISIIFPKTGWNVAEKWANDMPKVLGAYAVETLPNCDTRLILKPVKSIKVTEHEVLMPDEENGHRIYFDFKK